MTNKRANPNEAFPNPKFVMNGANHRMDCATTYPL